MMQGEMAQLARAYRVPLIDYERDGKSLLISSGAGIMMAVMDAVPRLRWCLDIDDLKPEHRLADFMLWASRYCELVIVAGWFSLTDPRPIREAIAQLPRDRLLTYGGGGVGLQGADDGSSPNHHSNRRFRFGAAGCHDLACLIGCARTFR